MNNEELLNCSFNRAIGKAKKFWDTYGDKFPEHYRKYYLANIYDIIDTNNINVVDDVTKSILNYLGLLSFNADQESQFLAFFEQYFNSAELYSKKIVGVTYDYLPTLANKISKEKADKSIRIYGPNIVTDSNDHLTCHKRSFSHFDLKDDDDMVVSFSPRENVERIFHAALNKKKELLLNFDGYVPDRDAFFIPSVEAYINELYEYALRNKSPEFDVDIVNYSMDNNQALVLKRK